MKKPVLMACLCLAALIQAGSKKGDDPIVEIYRQKADLTVRAFQCAIAAPDEESEGKVFASGLQAGRQFVDYFGQNRSKFSGKYKVAKRWSETVGPSTDFTLGAMYVMLAVDLDSLYTDGSMDPEKKAQFWEEHHCEKILSEAGD